MVPRALVFALGVPLGGTLWEAVKHSGDGDNLGEVGALEGGPYGVTALLFLTPHLSVSSYSSHLVLSQLLLPPHLPHHRGQLALNHSPV